MSITALPHNTELAKCRHCNAPVASRFKFCGTCGCRQEWCKNSQQNKQLQPFPDSIPRFAHIPTQAGGDERKRLEEETQRLIFLLARTRILLYLNCLAFLIVNLFGLALAFACHSQFIGDGFSKCAFAGISILFVNCPAMLFILPINLARREIAILKQKIHYSLFKLEFRHLF